MQRRAYSEDQKQQRRNDILNAASALFKDSRFESVTMVAIAKRAKVAKGTLYVYFKTKEELFLAYAQEAIGQFFENLEGNLSKHAEPMGVPGVIDALRQAYLENTAMVRLLALLHVVLESNTSFETALSFRKALIPLLEKTGREFERHLPFLKPDMGKRLLLTIHGMSLGFYQLSDPSPVIQQVEQMPGMELYRFDFAAALIGAVDLMLAGMETRSKE